MAPKKINKQQMKPSLLKQKTKQIWIHVHASESNKKEKTVLLQLAQDLISPKDDLGRELKDVKKKSKQKVEESLQQEMEESRVTEVADDGTLPMPEGEEEVKEEAVVTFRESEPGSPKEEEEGEESEVKRLRRKKEKVEESMYLIILVVSLNYMSCFLETKNDQCLPYNIWHRKSN